MHRLIENNKPGLVIYGSYNGYDKLYSLNVNSPKYYDDLYNVSAAFKLIDGYKQYSILGRTVSKLCSIFSIHTGNKDKEGRNVFYTISIIYENLTPSSDEVFRHIVNIQRKFQKDCIDEERKTIKLEQLDSFCYTIFPTLEFKRIISLNDVKDGILTIEDECYEWWDDLGNKDIFDYIDNFDRNNTVYLTSTAIKVGSNVTQIIDGTPIIRSFNILSVSNIKEFLQLQRTAKRFSFSPISNKNIIVPGTLTLKIGDRYSEHKIDNTPLPIELVVEDTAEVRLTFTPNDTIKFQKHEEIKPFTQLTGYQGSTLNLKIEEKASKTFEIKSDVPIYGIIVSCNGREIHPEQGYYTIYDQSGIVKITSTSHLPHDEDIRNISSNHPITLLSKNIELDIYDGNNKIPFSKEIEVTANGNRLSTNFISRSNLPIKLVVKSKKYYKNSPTIIPKDFTDSKYPIYLKNINEITGEKTSKNGGITSGIIGPENKKPRYSTIKAKATLITVLLFVLAVSAYFIFMNKEIIPNCDNIVKGTPQFEKYCKIDRTCKKCKAQPEKQKPDSVAAAQPSITKDDSIKIKETVSQSKPEAVSIPATSETKSEQIDCENVKSGTPQERNKFCEKIVNFGCLNCPITCKNFIKKSITEKKSFCVNVKNKDCQHCKPSCTNYNHLPKETQKAYCNDPKANCDKCLSKASQNVIPTSNNGTSVDDKEKQNDCNSLDELTGKTLENACKNQKFKDCIKCKKN